MTLPTYLKEEFYSYNTAQLNFKILKFSYTPLSYFTTTSLICLLATNDNHTLLLTLTQRPPSPSLACPDFIEISHLSFLTCAPSPLLHHHYNNNSSAHAACNTSLSLSSSLT